MRDFQKSVAVALATLCVGAMSMGVANAQAKQLRVRGSLQHVHGVNLPWIVNGTSNYGHDIGPNHFTGYGFNYNGGNIDSYFADIRNMRCNVVRIWLFENLEGLNFNSSGYITGIDGTFYNNLNDIITRANNRGVAVYLTLFNHSIGNEFGKVPHDGGGAVKNFFTDSGAQTSLINNVVRPLAQLVNGKNGVFALDLMNEANYAVSPYGGITASANWQQMHDWIYNLTGAIHGVSSTIQVSCSTDDANSFSNGNFWNRFGGVGLDFYDYHNYSDNPNIFTLGSTGPYLSINKPIILGEYGPSTQNNRTIQTNATDSFINQTNAKNWAGSLAWSYDTSWTGTYNLTTGLGLNGSTQYWTNAAWKIQWWGANKFGL